MTEFDDYSFDYKERHNRNLAVSGEDSDYFSRLKMALVKEVLGELAGSPVALLDVGAGVGKVQESVHEFLPHARSVAVDVSLPSLVQARRVAGNAHLFSVYDGSRLPFRDDSFDVVLFCTVLHHVPEEDRVPLMREASRVMRRGGRLLVFEHNPVNPLTRAVVADCEFDKDAVLLSAAGCRRLISDCGLSNASTRYYVFFPAFLRFLRFSEPILRRVPLGGQYMVVARKR